jgi:hypothetical protein
MTPTECGGWALWHPEQGFGQYLNVSNHMDDAVTERKLRVGLYDDDRWKVVPVRVVRVDYT